MDDSELYAAIIAKGSPPIKNALSVIDDALMRYRANELAFSFNGGKDCTVLLHLLRASLSRRQAVDPSYTAGNIATVYFQQDDDQFPELVEFMHSVSRKYGFKLKTYKLGYREGLWQMISDRPTLKAVFMGQRRSDPSCGNLSTCTPCDVGWPDLIRINAILDLSYADVWTFLRSFRCEYCSLYDEGFTSLGSMSKTTPNPLLQCRDDASFQPAFMLSDLQAERAGRQSPCRPPNRRTAAIISIGDELLTGHQADLNSPFLCAELHSIGIAVRKVSIVPDDLQSIVDEVSLLSRNFDVVVSCGGLGPTPDDITMEAMSVAFDAPLQHSQALFKCLSSKYSASASTASLEACSRMARVPRGSRLLQNNSQQKEATTDDVFPACIQVRNVFVFPGVPSVVREKFSAMKRILDAELSGFHCRAIGMLMDEIDLVPVLNRVQSKWGAAVSIGSYPNEDPDLMHKVEIRLESKSDPSLQAALQLFLNDVASENVAYIH